MLCSTAIRNCAVCGDTVTLLGTMLVVSLLPLPGRGGSREAPESIKQKEGEELLISLENLGK